MDGPYTVARSCWSCFSAGLASAMKVMFFSYNKMQALHISNITTYMIYDNIKLAKQQIFPIRRIDTNSSSISNSSSMLVVNTPSLNDAI